MDNITALMTINSSKISARNRHFLMRGSAVREAIENELIELKYTSANDSEADILKRSGSNNQTQEFFVFKQDCM